MRDIFLSRVVDGAPPSRSKGRSWGSSRSVGKRGVLTLSGATSSAGAPGVRTDLCRPSNGLALLPNREALETEYGHYVSGRMPDVLQAYTSQFRQMSTTFVMACSIVGMVVRLARLTPGKRTEWQRTWWVGAAAAAATPPSWRGAVGAVQPARHSWRGTSPRFIVALGEKHTQSSVNQILCLSDSVLCTARRDGKPSIEGDEECSCIRPECVTVSSGVCWTSNSSH